MLRRLFLGSLVCLCCLSTSVLQAQEKELLIYCGITMVRPITELARQFEQCPQRVVFRHRRHRLACIPAGLASAKAGRW